MDDKRMRYEYFCRTRLAEYGFGEGGWNPKKYEFYKKVNAVVKVRMASEGYTVPRHNQLFSAGYMERAMQIWDEILPPVKEGGKNNGTI